MGTRTNYSGLVVAGVGFFLTRFTVTLAIYENPVRFYLAGVVPLVLGLGLAAFGVALTVADVDRSLVRRTALWCLLGTASMLALVALTLVGSTAGPMPTFETVRSRTYLSNFLIGGSVGGTLTGLYAARTRRQREALDRQADRLEVLNRLLRHEVLNALTAIRGYASMVQERGDDARKVIDRRSDEIESTVEDVRYLTEGAGPGQMPVGPVDVVDCLTESVRTVTDEYPDAAVSVEVPDGVDGENRREDGRASRGDRVAANGAGGAASGGGNRLTVLANQRLSHVFTHLVENATLHADDGAVDVTVTATSSTVSVAVRDEGPGLPDRKQTLLENGDIGSFDNPGTGFGLYFVRFLVENYRGSIETDVDDRGTTVTVTLPRADADGTALRANPSTLTGVRPVVPHLLVTLGAALLAGVVYGLAAEQVGGSISVIGVLYGVQSSLVGWITHEFHSVVFGFVFAGLVSLAPDRYRDHVPAFVALGTGWALALWLVAAGIVSAVWLRLVGVPAPIPNLSVVTLVAHLAWGVSLGILTALGYRHVSPRLASVLG